MVNLEDQAMKRMIPSRLVSGLQEKKHNRKTPDTTRSSTSSSILLKENKNHSKTIYKEKQEQCLSLVSISLLRFSLWWSFWRSKTIKIFNFYLKRLKSIKLNKTSRQPNRVNSAKINLGTLNRSNSYSNDIKGSIFKIQTINQSNRKWGKIINFRTYKVPIYILI